VQLKLVSLVAVRYSGYLKAFTATVATMVWCEKYHRALFVIIHDKALLVMTNVLYQVHLLMEM